VFQWICYQHLHHDLTAMKNDQDAAEINLIHEKRSQRGPARTEPSLSASGPRVWSNPQVSGCFISFVLG
jgi:hypothetical protein